MSRVYLGLGSNIDPERNLRLGMRELRSLYGRLDVSAVYRNKAVGFDGPDFLNLVVGLDTRSGPRAVQAEIERIHALAGRRRGEAKFADRPLDIDLLMYDDLVTDEQGLHLPRADVLDYSFVLRPMAELAPDLRHPVTGRTMAEHWAAFDAAAQPLQAIDLDL